MPAQRGRRHNSPRSRRSPRKPRKLPVYLTEHERQAVLEAVARSAPRGVPNGALRDSALIAVGVFAGLRVSELAHLDVDDVDFEAMTVLVREGKGSKDRMVPLHTAAGVALLDYLEAREDNEAAMFLSRRGTRISVDAIQRMVRRVAADAGLRKAITPHKLRHSFATLLIEADVDVFTVQDLLGHASVATTQIYVHTSAARRRGAVDRL